MASSKEYLEFIMEQLSELDEISCKAMMGELFSSRLNVSGSKPLSSKVGINMR